MTNDEKEIKLLAESTQDPVLAAIERERFIAKRQRQKTVGALLDKAAEVLTDVLDTTDPANVDLRLRAAETAAKLYVEQGKLDVADDTLKLKEKALELERQKLAAPGGPLFQQNNLYIGAPQAGQSSGLTTEQEAQQLLLRKQAQNAILESYLAKPAEQIVEVSDAAEDVLETVVQEATDEDTEE